MFSENKEASITTSEQQHWRLSYKPKAEKTLKSASSSHSKLFKNSGSGRRLSKHSIELQPNMEMHPTIVDCIAARFPTEIVFSTGFRNWALQDRKTQIQIMFWQWRQHSKGLFSEKQRLAWLTTSEYSTVESYTKVKKKHCKFHHSKLLLWQYRSSSQQGFEIEIETQRTPKRELQTKVEIHQ